MFIIQIFNKYFHIAECHIGNSFQTYKQHQIRRSCMLTQYLGQLCYFLSITFVCHESYVFEVIVSRLNIFIKIVKKNVFVLNVISHHPGQGLFFWAFIFLVVDLCQIIYSVNSIKYITLRIQLIDSKFHQGISQKFKALFVFSSDQLVIIRT